MNVNLNVLTEKKLSGTRVAAFLRIFDGVSQSTRTRTRTCAVLFSLYYSKTMHNNIYPNE